MALLIDTLSGFVGYAEGNALTHYQPIVGDNKASALDKAVGQLPNQPAAAVWVVTGPGNFTAIRVGIGYARAIAWSLGVKSFGLGVFDIDHALIEAKDAVHYRDARGGRFYRATYAQDNLDSITLVNKVEAGWSAEGLEGASLIPNAAIDRAKAMVYLSDANAFNSSPAAALYVRGANAAISNDPPLLILDD